MVIKIFQKNIKSFFIFLFFLTLLICLFQISYSSENQDFYFSNSENSEFLENPTFHYNSNSIFSWPLFGYYTISSKFGYRVSPTTGASSYHSGIDIPAPEGTKIYSISNGKVIYTRIFAVLMDIQLLFNMRTLK